jgi:hypothetical protein
MKGGITDPIGFVQENRPAVEESWREKEEKKIYNKVQRERAQQSCQCNSCRAHVM